MGSSNRYGQRHLQDPQSTILASVIDTVKSPLINDQVNYKNLVKSG